MTRPHNRTTIITTDAKTFSKAKRLRIGERLTIECPNDIISSAKGGQSKVHHSIRRVSLLRRHIAGGYRRVKVRCEMGNSVPCVLTGKITGVTDASSFKVEVMI